MKKSSLRENTIFSIIYQSIVLFVPLITAPYLTRKIGADGLGLFSYTQSIAYYFFLIAMLGVNNYGSRTIAQARGSKKELSNAFWQIYYIQLFLGFFSLIIYAFFCIIFFPKQEAKMFWIQSILIISVFVDINWFAFGLERFKYTTVRNMLVKIYTVVMIFTVIKGPDDVYKYAFIITSGTVIGLLPNWKIVHTETEWEKPDYNDIRKHIKPNLILFIPYLASSIYQYMDKVMLGVLSDNAEVGFYTYAENIINVPMGIITAVCNVFMPHISRLIKENYQNQVNYITEQVFHITSVIEIALFCGIFCVSTDFAVVYLGSEFWQTGVILKYLSIIIIFSGTANVLRMIFLIPNKLDSLYARSVAMGALVNGGGNLILIPMFGTTGACITTISAYLIVMIYQILKTNKSLNYKHMLTNLIPYYVFGIVMIMLVNIINIENDFIRLAVRILCGGGTFIILTVVWSFVLKKDKCILSVVTKQH